MAQELERLSNYYDRKSGRDMDYRQFMEKKAMVRDIGAEIRRSAHLQVIGTAVVGAQISGSINRSSEQLQQSMTQMQTGIQTAINDQTYAIVASQDALAHTFSRGFDIMKNTLDMGFAGISYQLGSIESTFAIGFAQLEAALGKMSDAICSRLDAIHDIVNNPLLTQSRELYRRAVASYNKGFFEEALEDIKAAVEKNKTDYISWFLLGKTHLFGVGEFSNVINLDSAIEALTTAAKYISPDITANATAKLMAAEIWFYLGLAKYNKHNDLNFQGQEDEAKSALGEALQAFERSWGYSDRMLESRYNIARCKILAGNAKNALGALEEVIKRDKNYCLKIFDDSDFDSVQEDCARIIERIKLSVFPAVKEKYDMVKPLVDELKSLGNNSHIFFSIPAEFVESIPYFDVLNYNDKFAKMIPQIEEQIQKEQAQIAHLRNEQEAAAAFENEYQKAKAAIQNNIDAIKADSRDYLGFDGDYAIFTGNLDTLLNKLKGNISVWWNCPDDKLTGFSAPSSYLAEACGRGRTNLKKAISENYKVWGRLLKDDLPMLVELMAVARAKSNLEHKKRAKKASSDERRKILFLVSSIVLTISGIVLGIAWGTLIPPIAGFIIGGILMASMWNAKERGEGFGLVTFSPSLLIASILTGILVGSFRVGLIGVVVAIVLFFVAVMRLAKS